MESGFFQYVIQYIYNKAKVKLKYMLLYVLCSYTQ